MFYDMVTNFDGHWDKIPNNKTAYTLPMLKRQMKQTVPMNPTSTIFIKRIKNGAVEKCWKGISSSFERGMRGAKEVIWFNVSIEREIPCPSKYIEYSEGWYCEWKRRFESVPKWAVLAVPAGLKVDRIPGR